MPSLDSQGIVTLLGIAAEQEGAGAVALARLGITADWLRDSIEAQPVWFDTEKPTALTNLPFTDRAKKAMELALREALQLGHNYISTEHLLLGINRQGEWLLPSDDSIVRTAVIRLLTEYTYARQPTVERSERRAGGDRRKVGQ